jgi:hypothetical protein
LTCLYQIIPHFDIIGYAQKFGQAMGDSPPRSRLYHRH